MAHKILRNMENFALVEIRKNTPWNKQPKVGDYNNPYIKKITPCSFDKGRYISWETGKEEMLGEDTQVWKLFCGTCFRLLDGREVLISRDLKGNIFLTEDFRFNPCSMVRYEAKNIPEKE